ncbi:MAG: hypothetical protein ACYS7Y_31900 [Planctomycetota bacterium]|jgi:hypothetical protein
MLEISMLLVVMVGTKLMAIIEEGCCLSLVKPLARGEAAEIVMILVAFAIPVIVALCYIS